MTEFRDLSTEEKVFLQNSVGAMGVDPAHLTEAEIDRLLTGYTPAKSHLEELAEAHQKTASNRAARRRQARLDELTRVTAESPDLTPIAEFATTYGFVEEHVREHFDAQQQAAVAELRQVKEAVRRDETQREFDEAVQQARSDHYFELIMIGNNSRHPHQAEARELMAELWPSFDNWLDI